MIEVNVVGQVRLKRMPRYEDWALEILVKFRDKEELQVLSHQRQSGGVSQSSLLAEPVRVGTDPALVGTIAYHDHVPHELDEAITDTFLVGR